MGKGKKPEVVSGHENCKCEGCKHPSTVFSFCSEHYEWFKFGLITKAGKKVLDFDKKWEHFTAHFGQKKKVA